MSFLIINSNNVISSRVTSTRNITNITIDGLDSVIYFDFKEFWEDLCFGIIKKMGDAPKENKIEVTKFVKTKMREVFKP